jgi:hypothetical protein
MPQNRPEKNRQQNQIPGDVLASWDKLLNPAQLKRSLSQASVFVMAYELLKQSIIEKLQRFFPELMDERGLKIVSRYKEEVLDLHPKDVFHASCLWFRNSGALGDDDLAVIQQIRNHRNEVVHELPNYVMTAYSKISADLLLAIAEQLAKVDQWWIRNIEIPITPEFDEKRVKGADFEDVQSFGMIFTRIILAVFLEDDAYLDRQYHAWRKLVAEGAG